MIEEGEPRQTKGHLAASRAYLSGPMDFVASRAEEKKTGWRRRVGDFLRPFGVTVFDPWSKPEVRGLHEYGREDVGTVEAREEWTFEGTPDGTARRGECSKWFWETMHIDLRMVDVSDFVVACCPTNIYSVGTVHEIVVARQQHKPVLVVSPPVVFPPLEALRAHLAAGNDRQGQDLLGDMVRQVPIKPNPGGCPSLWYMPLVGSESFFDGFGFDRYREEFGWEVGPLDERECEFPPTRPLLPFLEGLNAELPKRWSASKRRFVADDDWLLLDLPR